MCCLFSETTVALTVFVLLTEVIPKIKLGIRFFGPPCMSAGADPDANHYQTVIDRSLSCAPLLRNMCPKSVHAQTNDEQRTSFLRRT